MCHNVAARPDGSISTGEVNPLYPKCQFPHNSQEGGWQEGGRRGAGYPHGPALLLVLWDGHGSRASATAWSIIPEQNPNIGPGTEPRPPGA